MSSSLVDGDLTPVAARVLILKRDRLCCEALRQIVRALFPLAAVAETAFAAEAGVLLATASVDLLLAGTTLSDGETADLLFRHVGSVLFPRRTLIVTGSRQPQQLDRLHALPIGGIFDSSTEDAAALTTAVRRVVGGAAYMSQTMVEHLQAGPEIARLVRHRLTLTEQVVFATLGDGSDDAAAEKVLGLKESTIQSVRRSLHGKLGVQHKGQLVCLAARYGCVRFTAEGVVRPGFERMLAEWRGRRRGRGDSASD